MAKNLEVRNEGPRGNDLEIFPEFDRLAERFFGDRFGSLLGDWPAMTRRTSMDVRETDQAYVLSAEIPGIPMKDVDVSVSGNQLTIKAEQNDERGGENQAQGYQRQYRSFYQSMTLPSNVNPEKIE